MAISRERSGRRLSDVRLPPFQELVDCHGRDVHRFVIAMVGPTEADDCYQETWLAALRAYPGLEDASNLRGWVFTIARRKALDHFRQRNRAPALGGEMPEPVSENETPASSGIWGMVRQLPAKQRMAVALRYVVDADYALISSTMGTSEDAARRNVHEGLKRLRMEYT
jgi:RNA polymerase sigma factor (sigma-70 family)